MTRHAFIGDIWFPLNSFVVFAFCVKGIMGLEEVKPHLRNFKLLKITVKGEEKKKQNYDVK